MKKYTFAFLFLCSILNFSVFSEDVKPDNDIEKSLESPKAELLEPSKEEEQKKDNENERIEEYKREFNMFISEGYPMLHPHVSYNADEAQLLTALSEGLFIYDPLTLEPIGGIAESWKVTGGRTWRFNIRENAKFENGDAITAYTFKESWLNLLSPELNCPYASLLDCIDGVADWRLGKLKNKNQIGIQVESERVLTVYTTSPCQYLPLILCHHAFSAVHPSQLKDVVSLLSKKEFKQANDVFKPISSGPFKIGSISEDEIILDKNMEYWDESFVHLSKIRAYLRLKDDSTSYKFNLGELDWLNKASVVKDIADKGAVHVSAMFSTEYFFFRVDKGSSENEKIREALLLAIPYEKLRTQYLIPASTLVFPLQEYPRVQGIDEYNIYKAKALMENIKLNEKNKKIVVIFPENTYYESLVKILEEAWIPLGFIIETKKYSPQDYYEAIKKPGYNLAVLSWIADFADPTSFLEMFRPGSNINYTAWDNAEYEALLRLANAEDEIKNRYKKLAEVEQLLLRSHIIIPLSHNPSINVIDLYSVAGWYPNAINIHPFKFIKFKKSKALPGVAFAF
ncbi:MAG: peptide ABC transporter substrate-binding protein [Treponema sp.]